MEKHLRLISAVTITALIAVIIIALTALHSRYQKTSTETKVCLTTSCIHTASTVLKYIDPTVDPCDNFYEFACGNFIKHAVIPDDESAINWFSITTNKVHQQLRAVIEEPAQKTESRPNKLIRTLYKACMNESQIEKESMKIIQDILAKVGGWPVVEGDNWNSDEFNWKKSVYKFRKLGFSVNYLFEFSAKYDWKNPLNLKPIIYLDQPPLGLDRQLLLKGYSEKMVTAYYDYMVTIATLLGANKTRATDELKECLDFEIELAKISLPREERANYSALYNPTTVGELEAKIPSFPWLEYMNTILAPYAKIRSDDMIIVTVPNFFTKLENLINWTPNRVLANYLIWRVVAVSVPFLSTPFRKVQNEYTKVKELTRWQECILVLEQTFGPPVEALYIRKYLNNDVKEKVSELTADLQAEFTDILENTDWMDNKTKNNALEKIESITTATMSLATNFEQQYSDLELDENHFLHSLLNISLLQTRTVFKMMKRNLTEPGFNKMSPLVNAYNAITINNISLLCAGILQEIFFDPERPRYMNYGSLGFIIGHELTHSFDNVGRQFDDFGALSNWWTPETEKLFLKKVQCLVDQYGNYTLPGLNLTLNGNITQGENIADNGGIKEAYLAYKNWVQRHGTEDSLPGLDYTPNQMFWISSALIWCEKVKPESLKMQVLSDPHSPKYFRVLGPLSNSEYFGSDFHCPVGSKMNPKKKCNVW